MNWLSVNLHFTGRGYFAWSKLDVCDSGDCKYSKNNDKLESHEVSDRLSGHILDSVFTVHEFGFCINILQKYEIQKRVNHFPT